MTPQELIDMPGHGNASAQVKRDGNWDEDKGKPYVTWMVDVAGYVYVDARSQYEALDVADEDYCDDICDFKTSNAEELK